LHFPTLEPTAIGAKVPKGDKLLRMEAMNMHTLIDEPDTRRAVA